MVGVDRDAMHIAISNHNGPQPIARYGAIFCGIAAANTADCPSASPGLAPRYPSASRHKLTFYGSAESHLYEPGQLSKRRVQ
jgi:hypothetical protein